jgi:hypothetical protein
MGSPKKDDHKGTPDVSHMVRLHPVAPKLAGVTRLFPTLIILYLLLMHALYITSIPTRRLLIKKTKLGAILNCKC